MFKGITPPRAAAGAVTQSASTASKAILLCFAAVAAPIGTAAASPYAAEPAAVPGTIEAERFDRGGEGVGYHEVTPDNYLGQFRPYEGVDIRNDPRSPGNNWIVSGIETGEWTAYTIDVATAGTYQWGVLAATAYNGAAYHFELDGWNMTGKVAVPNTGSWDGFRWVGAPNVHLNRGRYVLKVVSEAEYFDLDLIVIAPAPGQTQILQAQPLQPSAINFACAFNALPACGFIEQARVSGRATLTSLSRDGGTALRLHTEPGDYNVVGSGMMERDDVYLATPGTADAEIYGEGVEQWWAHSILFPDDFVMPTQQSYVVFDFHNTGSGAGQANFHVAFEPSDDITTPISQPGQLKFIAHNDWGRYGAVIGQVQKNYWYDFVYHVRWSSGSDGLFYAWVNGKLVLQHQGPTLYSGQGVYLKLANYHQPVCTPYPACAGSDQPSSVIHDRVIRGTTAQSVALGPLEYYP